MRLLMKVVPLNQQYYWVIYRTAGSIVEVSAGLPDSTTATEEGTNRLLILKQIYKVMFPDGIY